MDLASVENDCMVTDVQGLLSAFETQASAHVMTQPHGNRRSADEVVVGVWGTDRVVVVLYGREADVAKSPMRANFGDDGCNQLTVPLGFRVHRWDTF